MKINTILASAFMLLALASCKKENPDPTPTPAVYNTVEMTVPFDRNAPFKFFNFKTGTEVASTDSASIKWDIAIRYVDIIINSHSSGPGNGAVITQMVDATNNITFDGLKEAPAAGYAYDTTATTRAINTGLTTGWYNYDRNTHAFSSKADRFFIIRTADNHYVKMEIVSVNYKDFQGPTPITLIYKFRYAYQPDDNRKF